MEEQDDYGYGRPLPSRRASLHPLSSLEVLMYDSLPNGSISYHLLAEVDSEKAFVDIMTHLPDECGSVRVLLYMRGEVVGNAAYTLYRNAVEGDPSTSNYINVTEFGKCCGLWRLFSGSYHYFEVYTDVAPD